jgi:fibro-slime domain-containing protein
MSLPIPIKFPKRMLNQKGFVLAITILLILGVTAISVGTMFNSKTGRMSASNYKNKLQNFTAADGLVTLLTQELINGKGAKYIDTSRYGMIKGQVWVGLPGTAVKDIKNKMITQPIPDLNVTSKYLGNDVNFDNYGVKWYGYLIPPATGNYTFTTRSDDASNFYLSTDTSVANLSTSPLCSLATWVYSWPSSGSGVSQPIPLIGGNRYYFTYWQKEGNGVDLGQMGWDGPDYFSERPITGKYLSQYSSDPVWDTTVMVGNLPVNYTVLGNGVDNFRITTEAITTKPGNSSDTIFRTPLKQTVSLKGAVIKPPSTLVMKAIYYDYLTDGSNPEFDKSNEGLVRSGMVNATITDSTSTDAVYFSKAYIGKPTKSGTNYKNRGCGLNMWFKDWVNTVNVYKYAAGSEDDCTTKIFDATGDAWKNTKIKDSLVFKLDTTQGAHTYVYSMMGNYNTGNPETSWRGDATEFFPLDKYGKDPVGSTHNYSFCMELHSTFTHQSGLIFEFTGDDDAWVFINNKLVIDLGGMHVAANDMLYLDDLPLNFGQTYNFDFFQCERHRVNSSTRIATNIQMAGQIGPPVANWRRDYGSLD